MAFSRLRRLSTLVLALLALGPGARPAHADSQSASNGGGASASLMFAIHIPVVLRMKVMLQPPLRVTREDIARGYVETSLPQEVLVTCNLPREYSLRLEMSNPLFKRVTLSEARQSRSFGTEGLTLTQPPTPPSTSQATHRFHYRFELPADLAPGDYPWPLTLALIQP
jgi:hypothetical protein